MAQEYKLKGLSGLDLKPGEKREVEVDGIEGGKVLLCNVGGKVTALGSKCTHYGAPLVKGILTGKYPPQGNYEGRIINSLEFS
jgi:nitrite reductase/ring-hydroxylating ferredoxin subunit